MSPSGPGIYFDGITTVRREVTVELAPDALRVLAADGALLAQWRYDEVEELSAPEDVLRIGRVGNRVLARLELRNPELIAALDERSLPVDRGRRGERRLRRRIVLWSVTAAASLIIVAVVALPQIATRITPLIPHALERRLGQAIDAQVNASLDASRLGPEFECGRGELHGVARTAFLALIERLERGAELPYRFDASVVRRPEANAIALPGGRIYVFEGLVARADSADELAGVIAHEIGHIAHRDGTRSIIEGAGLSLLFGILLGDFVGGGAVVVAATAILRTSYSRDVEAAADAYSVELMSRIGADPRALGRILLRIADTTHPGPRILLDHPDTRARVAAIERLARPAAVVAAQPPLTEGEWTALKAICAQP